MFARIPTTRSHPERLTHFTRALCLALASITFLCADAAPSRGPSTVQQQASSSFKLAAGAIVGIVVGIIVFWIIVAVLVFVIIRKRRARRNVSLASFPGGGTGFNSGPPMAHANHMHGIHHTSAPPPPPDSNITGANFSSGPVNQPTSY